MEGLQICPSSVEITSVGNMSRNKNNEHKEVNYTKKTKEGSKILSQHMTRVSSEHGFAMTRMGQIYLGGMTVKKEMYVMSWTKMEGVTIMTQGHG